ncbi:hypothetical protein M3A96_08525 [Helcobacillus massiliensis]|uniref:hypothetical protein n=1 Tax=Helcobacillus massiliensis TaxID=521392 RepID=UPI0021A4144B|nr:hypothetical protein [Helcobacillus massiliensis]MCT1558157.1 hypothetical protein [Helcobacillus massiliensis]MCT2036488.1 hypothetical protein [Helcobacillus massiliensis]MCT2332292.1 hypothetical protein [Helcobacillus massiliensis]MDK7741722.1 hypothetical protein [Helcobacillus massiliensis]WOO92182.1 hypothetical protein R3I40_07110 [Helcobacillus massiliensis]
MTTTGRRNLLKGATWAAPVIAVSTMAPAYAGSPVPGTGTLVAAPWSNTWRASNQYKGAATILQPWVIYPTTRPSGTVAVTNETPASQTANPLTRKASAWDPIYPDQSTGNYNGNKAEAPGAVGKGDVIEIFIENIGGKDSYAPQPRVAGQEHTTFTHDGTRYGPDTYGAAWPDVLLRDYRPNNPDSYYDFLKANEFSGAGVNTGKESFTGVPYTTADGRHGWKWVIELTNPVDNEHDGSDAVTFDIRYPEHRPEGSFPKQTYAQYRTTVISPWGTVVYTSA